MSTCYTPGPWRCVLTDDDGFRTYHIEIIEGHIASVFGWSKDGVACPVTQANATLIEHAPARNGWFPIAITRRPGCRPRSPSERVSLRCFHPSMLESPP